MLGYGLLLACAAAAVSLLSWSVGDPSLTRATNAAARNFLGPLGAVLSDVLLQTLGLASVFVVLPPLFWSMQLIGKEPVLAWRRKLVLMPVAILALSGAFSSLPVPASWPLHHGLGGIMGDGGLGLLTSWLIAFNPDRAASAAGLFLFAGGLMALLASLGLSQTDLKRICQDSPRPAASGFGLGVITSWRPRLPTGLLGANEPELATAMQPRAEPTLAPAPYVAPAPGMRIEPTLGTPAPERPLQLNPERAYAAAAAPVMAATPRVRIDPPAVEFAPEPIDSGRGVVFDHSTDADSVAIAERFAPAVPNRVESAPLPLMPAAAEPGIETAMDSPGPAHGGSGAVYRRPPFSMLRRQPVSRSGGEASQAALHGQAQQLASVLADFGVRGEIRQIHPGPVVTLFEFEPARGVKTSRIMGLADDIARSLGAPAVRVAVVPGRNAIGIELPSLRREKVFLRELLEDEGFRSPDLTLPLALGRGISGAPVYADLARMPHLLVAGTTGSGKSVGVNGMILSMLYRLAPEQLRLVMIDPKMLELSVYNGIPHLMCPVVTDPEKAVSALNWAVREMESRYQRMSRLGVRSIDVYNNRVRTAQRRDQMASRVPDPELAPMPHIVIVVDEFADLMMVAGKELEAAVKRLAQMARAAGMHLIMATQRPSVDVLTGTIKANFPTRISFRVASKFDSRTILNEQGAEQLLGQGDMLFAGGGGRVQRVHGPFVSDEEVEAIATYLRSQGSPRYVDGITDAQDEEVEADTDHDAAREPGEHLYNRAVALMLRERKVSVSHLRQRLRVRHEIAAQLLQRMQREGVLDALERQANSGR